MSWYEVCELPFDRESVQMPADMESRGRISMASDQNANRYLYPSIFVFGLNMNLGWCM